jgi:hypothetical protein
MRSCSKSALATAALETRWAEKQLLHLRVKMIMSINADNLVVLRQCNALECSSSFGDVVGQQAVAP